jgi:glycine/D-amino acid oxidase-like deaminating enzyme
MTAQRSVVILGAGVIGLSTAYYISASISPTDPIQVFILDTSPVLFQCASGRAAGFIARDWFSSSLAELGELSFRLHKELADRYDGRRNWGYSGTVALSLNETHNNNDLRSTEGQRGEDWLLEGDTRRITASRTSSPSNHHPEWPQWLKKVDAHLLSTADSTAQV